MGIALKTLGQHHLNSADIESLAHDFSKYFHAYVDYGYQDKFTFDGFMLQEGSYEIISLGKVEPAIKTSLNLRLYDEQYDCKREYAQWGDIFVEAYRREYPHEDPFDSCYDCYKSNGDSFACIQKDLFYYDMPYFSKWGSFCEIFTGDNTNWNRFMDFRRQLRFGYSMVGIREIMYINDYGDEIVDYPNSWNDLLQSVEKYKTQGLHIPNFAREKTFVKEYPVYFTDDFSDLDN